MIARRIGFWLGLAAFALTIIVPAPGGMTYQAWHVAGLLVWMAAWWMSQAMPLTATALLPFVVLPMSGVMTANEVAAAYYAPTLFLILGGAFIALAIERTGLHRRLALAILARARSSPGQLLFAFMAATAILSMLISNTSTALIMMPMALAVLVGGGIEMGKTEGIAGALPMGIAFAASIGGLATIVGSPTNAIAVALLDRSLGLRISFAEWSLYGVPLVIAAIPLAWFIVSRVQRVAADPFDIVGARAAIAQDAAWTVPQGRLMAIVAATMAAWIAQPLIEPLLPAGSLTDGTIAIVAALFLFVLPDGSGRPMLRWPEANRAPWDVIMMFGGGLALAAGMSKSGLAEWLGTQLLPVGGLPLIFLAITVVALMILITEFASNVAAASAIMPIVASLAVALGADPILLALPAAFAASWGFMLPSGTGPNAIAWATGNIALPRMLKAGVLLDAAGAVLIVAVIWAVAAFT